MSEEKKLGPWLSKDYENFIALDVELKSETPAAGGLMSLSSLVGKSDDEAQKAAEFQKKLEGAWAVRRAHPVYKALQADPNFRAAWSAFESSKKRSASAGLKSPTAPFVFLREYVKYAGHYYSFGKPRLHSKGYSYGPSAKRRRQATKHATELVSLIDQGVRLSDYSKTPTLRSLLKDLLSELAATSRKSYGGARENERWVLNSLAHSLYVYCGLKSPAVVTHFARMVGASCEEKTAQRYCNQQARKWDKLVKDNPL